MIEMNRKVLFLLLTVMASSFFLLQASQAQAFGYLVEGRNCSKQTKLCPDFSVTFWDAKFKVGESATICWLGNCQGGSIFRDSNNGVATRPLARARYNNVGPYRCGTPTIASITYKGRTYRGSKKRIICMGSSYR